MPFSVSNKLLMQFIIETKQSLKNLEKVQKSTKKLSEENRKLALAAREAAKRKRDLAKATRKVGRGFISAGTKVRSFIAALTGIGALAGGVFILGKAVRKMVEDTVAGVKASAKLDAVLKTTGFSAGLTKMQLDDMSLALSQVTTFSQTEITEGQGILATFTKIGDKVFPRATEAAMDMATVFGQTLQQSAIQLGMALQDPIGAVGRLKRVGVDFNEEQKKMIREFVEMNDVAAAQDVILQGLEGQVGGTSKAIGDTLIGSIEQLVQGFSLMFEQIGFLITEIPSLTIAVDNMNDAINGFTNMPLGEKFQHIADALIKATTDFTLFWITVGPVLDAFVAWFLRKPLVIGVALDFLSRALATLALRIELLGLKWTKFFRDFGAGDIDPVMDFLELLGVAPGGKIGSAIIKHLTPKAPGAKDEPGEIPLDERISNLQAEIDTLAENDPLRGSLEDIVKNVSDSVDNMMDKIGLGVLDAEAAKAWEEKILGFITEEMLEPWTKYLIERNRKDAEEQEKIKKRQEAIKKLTNSWLDRVSQFTQKLEKAGVDLQALGRGMGLAMAETRSMRDIVGQAIASTLATEAEEWMSDVVGGFIKKQFGEAGEQSGLGEGMTALLGGVVGGWVGGAVMKLFNKKPKVPKKPIPVKVVNWGDMTQQLLKASTRRAVSPMITTGGNSVMSANFSREARI